MVSHSIITLHLYIYKDILLLLLSFHLFKCKFQTDTCHLLFI